MKDNKGVPGYGYVLDLAKFLSTFGKTQPTEHKFELLITLFNQLHDFDKYVQLSSYV